MAKGGRGEGGVVQEPGGTVTEGRVNVFSKTEDREEQTVFRCIAKTSKTLSIVTSRALSMVLN